MHGIPSLSVFFPAYNEEGNIEQSVKQADRVLQTLGIDYEIIVVDDGSKDKTGQIADQLAEQNSRVRVIHHAVNEGYGAAVWSGIQAARLEYIFFTDGDLQFNLEEISSLLKYVSEYEVVIGYRARRRDSMIRLLNAKAWNILNRVLFGLKVKDIDCAFKLFKREVVQAIPVASRGAMFSAELLVRLERKGIAFKEVPVTHLPRVRGNATGAKPAVIVRAFKELLAVYRGELGNDVHVAMIKFGIVGVFNTLVDWIVYYGLTRGTFFFSTHVASAKGISFMIATIPSFTGNKYWTFKGTGAFSFAELFRFYSTTFVSVGLNVMTVYLLVHFVGWHDLAAVLVATLVSFLWNFSISHFWVFRKPVVPLSK
jgi:glycosyltransferase involved in cell wall biosynthesis